jgi:hypothetical protein
MDLEIRYKMEYQRFRDKTTKKYGRIEDILNKNNLFVNQDHLRGIIHNKFKNYHSKKELSEEIILHISNFINDADSIKKIIKELEDCNCDICISLLDRNDKLNKFIKILNKRPRFQKREIIKFLLSGEKITLENVRHCFETKILKEHEEGGCNCIFHKGRFNREFLYYIEPSVKDFGMLESEWIRTRRKDLVYDRLFYNIAYSYDFGFEFEDEVTLNEKLFIRKQVLFTDLDLILLIDIYHKIYDLKSKAFYFIEDIQQIKKECEEIILMLELAKKQLKSTKSKLISIDPYIEEFKRQIERIEQDPEEFKRNDCEFTDNIYFDLEFYSTM